MTQRTPRRTRPAVDTLDAEALARLERGQGGTQPQEPAPGAESDAAGSDAQAAGSDAQAAWRDRLASLVEAGRLTAQQEADCFRLFREHEAHARETMPRLLAELKPHFDTEGEAQAKLRFTEALQAMKHRQHDDLARLLKSFGIDFAPPGP